LGQLLLQTSRKRLTARKSRIEGTLECRRRSGALDHDQIIVLLLRPDAEKFAAPVRSNRPSIW
jgi:hypothetical protein